MRSPYSIRRGIKTGLWLLGVLALYFAPLANSMAQQTRDVLAGQKLAVMPCRLGKAMPETPAAKKQIIDCTLSQLCYLEGDPMADAADIITNLLQQELQRRYGQNVLPQKAVQARFDPHPENPDETLRDMAVRLGKKLRVDYVVAATLWRFDEREGTASGVKKPASVAFAVFLIRVKDGKLIWQDTFNKTQAPLSENLLDARLYMKEGLHWLTAEQYAQYGIESMLASYLGK